MADVGSAYLNVIPKIKGLSDAVQKEMDKAEAVAGKKGASSGQRFSTGFSGGAIKAGAAVGAASAIVNKAMSAVSSHVESAISRFDTLNNYPTVMTALGYSAQDADASISKMSDRLQGLPTTLDSMVSLVQGLVTTTGDLGKATDAGLALNDMLVAAGASTQLTNAAMEQFRQILSKGKPEMEDWRSLTSAMPGQMDQLAKAMLGPTANANDLYAALGGGKNEAILSMDDLLNAMIRLDAQGGEGFASFQEQAETAAGGVSTAMVNCSNAVTRGIASMLDTIGKDTIAGGFNDLKGGINGAFETANSGLEKAMPTIKGVASAAKEMAPELAAGAAAFIAVKGGAAGVSGVAASAASGIRGVNASITAFQSASGAAAKASALFSGSLPTLAITGLAAAAAVAAAKYTDWKTKTENLEKATDGLSAAASSATGLSDYTAKLEGVGQASEGSKKSVDELIASVARHTDSMNESNAKAQEQIAQLNTAQSIIDQYAGVTDLSTEAQGRLQWALDQVNQQFGLSITVADAMAGSYTNANGEVVNLRESIDNLIDAKKREVQMTAMSDQLGEAYAAQTDAAQAYVQAVDRQSEAERRYLECKNASNAGTAAGSQAVNAAKKELDAANDELSRASDSMDHANDAVNQLETGLGDAQRSASDAATAYDKWANSLDGGTRAIMEACLSEHGGMPALKKSLEDLGVTQSGLAELGKHDMQELARSYDGTATSIVGKLQEWGVEMDSAASANAKAAGEIAAALGDMAGAADVLDGAGINVNDFSNALADAGVTSEKVRAVGSENLARLAESCDGDVNQMVQAIELWNAAPLIDKDGSVNVDDAKLLDATGNVYTWNGTALVDKSGAAAVDGTSVVDATGQVWEWNGTVLVNKDSHAIVSGNAVTGQAASGVSNTSGAIGRLDGKTVDVNANGNYSSAAASIWDLGSAIRNLASKSIDVVTNKITNSFGHAAGGIRPNAAGGVRMHAGGAIATRAMPLDIVGEAGAEAIVPLTNERYSRPFADVIAKQVAVNNQDMSIEAARMVIAALPGIIADYTPVMGEREFGRKVRKAAAYA